MQKKIMLLGGIRYLLPVIKAAHDLGFYVITADYLPDNIAHKYSDEYVNVSIIDKEAVLRVAREKQIDGILSYGVDPGVVSAAYVAEQMGLPFQCSYDAACILQDKSLFRQFLQKHGFNSPQMADFKSFDEAVAKAESFEYPVIVKPVDSAGSKGVSKVEQASKFEDACRYAFDNSISDHIIVEQFLEAEGTPSGSESFFVDGELKYNAFYDQLFDMSAANKFAPAIEYWPSAKPKQYTEEIQSELQRLGNLLGITTGLFNIEWRVSGGKAYLMEVSPRAGGNRLAEILNYATDVDIIYAETVKSVGIKPEGVKEPTYNGYYAIYNIHSEKAGVLEDIVIDEELAKNIVEKEIRVAKGDTIIAFTGANASLGTLFLKFENGEEMKRILSNIHNYLIINIYGGGRKRQLINQNEQLRGIFALSLNNRLAIDYNQLSIEERRAA